MVEHKKQLPVYSDTSGCLLIQVGIKYDVMVVRTVRVCGALEAGEGTDTAGQPSCGFLGFGLHTNHSEQELLWPVIGGN